MSIGFKRGSYHVGIAYSIHMQNTILNKPFFHLSDFDPKLQASRKKR